MKRLLTILTVVAAIFNCSAQNPTRTVLYACGPDDDFYCCEFYSNMKVTGNKFACVTRNKNTSKLSFILNGGTVATAQYMDIFWIDTNSKNNCIYAYADNDRETTLVVEGQTYGPYEQIAYWKHACKYNWDGTPNLDLAYNKHSFTFKNNGKVYLHDNDGSVYDCQGENAWNANRTAPKFKSSNGAHTAQFSGNLRRLTFNGNSYNLPIDADANDSDIRLNQCYLTDEGTCIVDMAYNTSSGWKYPYFIIKNNTIRNISDEEYFDPTTNSVKRKYAGMPTRQPRQMEAVLRWRDGGWASGIDITLHDKMNRHHLTANWNNDYVMVDDRRFGKTTPINAFYDETNNSFGWVAIEGKQLVLYSYRL